MNSTGGFVLVGGTVFDSILAAPATRQSAFLRTLGELRRRPSHSGLVDIEEAPGWGVDAGYVAAYEGVHLSYLVAARYVFLIDVFWVDTDLDAS
ncbi:MAG: hypothetical protein ACE5E8_01685 [Acidimicrobiia bacterium]